MYSKQVLEHVRRLEQEWEKLRGAEANGNERTLSGLPLKPVYTPADAEEIPFEEIGFPGVYPFTRGIHPEMYRRKLWTMRQFAGMGLAEDTNRRFHYLLSQGQTGLSTAFHLPTLMGVDSDDPLAQGEVGKEGVAVDSLRDMEVLFDGVDLEKVTTSMTINGPAAVVWAMYLVMARKRGADWKKISGTIQNDILKEYIAQKTYIFPPEHGLKLVVDTFEFGTREVPRWNTISISGYHIREAGATAVQELAFTLADGKTYVEAALERGLKVDDFAPRLSFFFDAHLDFFEEVAKFRAARRIWAKLMREKYGAKNPRSWLLRFHAQTAGVSLTAQQPENNIVRTALEAFAAVLGGAQSLHTNAMDETWALPSEKAALIALRTQQILAREIGVRSVADPLGGSYFVEDLTGRTEQAVYDYFERIEQEGGVLRSIQSGFLQKEIARSAYEFQRGLETGERVWVGVNRYQMEEELEIPVLKIAERAEEVQRANLAELKRSRDNREVARRLQALEKAAAAGSNVMPALLEAVEAYCTLGEMVGALKRVYGAYREPAFF